MGFRKIIAAVFSTMHMIEVISESNLSEGL